MIENVEDLAGKVREDDEGEYDEPTTSTRLLAYPLPDL